VVNEIEEDFTGSRVNGSIKLSKKGECDGFRAFFSYESEWWLNEAHTG